MKSYWIFTDAVKYIYNVNIPIQMSQKREHSLKKLKRKMLSMKF